MHAIAETTVFSKLPQASLQAWETMLQHLAQKKSLDSSHSIGLRISVLPGFETLLALHPESWVNHYEMALQRIYKQQRKNGDTQTGVFYTPAHVAKYLAQQSLQASLKQMSEQIHTAMAEKNDKLALQFLQKAQALKVIDPACGTGVFLVEALQVFHQFYQEIAQAFPHLPTPNSVRFAFTHQIYGVDIDPLSVMISEARLYQWAQILDETNTPFPLHPAATNLWPGNTLSFDETDTISNHFSSLRRQAKQGQLAGSATSATAIENAETFQWKSAFPEVEAWDFVLGNPPYVSEVRRQAERFRGLQAKNASFSKGAYYQAKMDLCDAFLAWGIETLQPNGQLAYVLPEYWTQRASTAQLRKALCHTGAIQEYWRFEGSPLFKNAPGHHSSLLIWKKRETETPVPAQMRYAEVSGDSALDGKYLKTVHYQLDSASHKLVYGDAVEMGLMTRLSKLPPLLQKSQIQQGVVLPQGRLKAAEQQLFPDIGGVFLLTRQEVEALHLNADERQLLKPYFQPTGFQAFAGFKNAQADYWLIYTDMQHRKHIAEHPNLYPNLRAHLDRFAGVNTSAFAPYGLHRARQPKWFEAGVKIFSPRQVMQPAFAVVEETAYVGEGFYSIQADNPLADYWITLLNSDLAWFWFYQQKRKGRRLQIDKDVLQAFPSPPLDDEKQAKAFRPALEELANRLKNAASREQNRTLKRQCNEMVSQLYQLSSPEILLITKAARSILGVDNT